MAIDVTIDGKAQLALMQPLAPCLYGADPLDILCWATGESLLGTNHLSLTDNLPSLNVVGQADYSGDESA